MIVVLAIISITLIIEVVTTLNIYQQTSIQMNQIGGSTEVIVNAVAASLARNMSVTLAGFAVGVAAVLRKWHTMALNKELLTALLAIVGLTLCGYLAGSVVIVNQAGVHFYDALISRGISDWPWYLSKSALFAIGICLVGRILKKRHIAIVIVCMFLGVWVMNALVDASMYLIYG